MPTSRQTVVSESSTVLSISCRCIIEFEKVTLTHHYGVQYCEVSRYLCHAVYDLHASFGNDVALNDTRVAAIVNSLFVASQNRCLKYSELISGRSNVFGRVRVCVSSSGSNYGMS